MPVSTFLSPFGSRTGDLVCVWQCHVDLVMNMCHSTLLVPLRELQSRVAGKAYPCLAGWLELLERAPFSLFLPCNLVEGGVNNGAHQHLQSERAPSDLRELFWFFCCPEAVHSALSAPQEDLLYV